MLVVVFLCLCVGWVVDGVCYLFGVVDIGVVVVVVVGVCGMDCGCGVCLWFFSVDGGGGVWFWGGCCFYFSDVSICGGCCGCG